MPFSGFLKPKPSGGRKPMIGKQIITPGSANIPINFGFHDGTGYSSAVVVPVAKVLNDTTIAGQAGTMPHKTGANTGTLYVTSGNIDAVPPLGYYDGTTSDYVHMPEPNLIAANILSGISMFGVVGTAKKFATGSVWTGITGFTLTVSSLPFSPSKVILVQNSPNTANFATLILLSSATDIPCFGGSTFGLMLADSNGGLMATSVTVNPITSNGFSTDKASSSNSYYTYWAIS